MITKKLRETAKRYSKMDSETLFKLFYDALPKTSARFAELTADVNAMATAIVQEKGK